MPHMLWTNSTREAGVSRIEGTRISHIDLTELAEQARIHSRRELVSLIERRQEELVEAGAYGVEPFSRGRLKPLGIGSYSLRRAMRNREPVELISILDRIVEEQRSRRKCPHASIRAQDDRVGVPLV